MHDEEVFRLRKQIRALNRRLQRERPVVEGLSYTTLRLLLTVERSVAPMRPGQLATELQMTNSNVAAALRSLEAQGMVVLRSDPEDGRKAIVDLTKKGIKVVGETRQRYSAWLHETIEGVLTKSEQRLLLQAGFLMQRLADHAESSAKKQSIEPGKTRRQSLVS